MTHHGQRLKDWHRVIDRLPAVRAHHQGVRAKFTGQPRVMGAEHAFYDEWKLGGCSKPAHVIQRLVTEKRRTRHLIPRLLEKDDVDIHSHRYTTELGCALEMTEHGIVVVIRLHDVKYRSSLVDDACKLLQGHHPGRHQAAGIGQARGDLLEVGGIPGSKALENARLADRRGHDRGT